MTETDLQRKVRDALILRFPGSRFYKIPGGPYGTAGLPDLVGCVYGHFVAIELKLPGKEDTLTPRQRQCLERLRDSGAYAAMATTVEQAVAIAAGEMKKHEQE